ncbi:MAG: hypothetical protein LBD53_02565, partial [Tannerella sp.]|nr:hypothetical protein [Tannerella sp.]
MKTKHHILLIIITCLSSLNVAAQDTEFWFTVPHLSEAIVESYPLDRPAFFAIVNSSDVQANVQIKLYNGGYHVDINTTIAPGDLYRRDFITDPEIKQLENPRGTAGDVTTYGIHITSNVPVVAYYMANHPASRDIFTLKGRRALGTSFYVPM